MQGKDKPNLIYLARLAEQTERFDDMVGFVKEIVREDIDVTEEIRNLVSIAYKNVMGLDRTTWRAVYNLEQKEKEKVAQTDAGSQEHQRHQMVPEEDREQARRELQGDSKDHRPAHEEEQRRQGRRRPGLLHQDDGRLQPVHVRVRGRRETRLLRLDCERPVRGGPQDVREPKPVQSTETGHRAEHVGLPVRDQERHEDGDPDSARLVRQDRETAADAAERGRRVQRRGDDHAAAVREPEHVEQGAAGTAGNRR